MEEEQKERKDKRMRREKNVVNKRELITEDGKDKGVNGNNKGV